MGEVEALERNFDGLSWIRQLMVGHHVLVKAVCWDPFTLQGTILVTQLL